MGDRILSKNFLPFFEAWFFTFFNFQSEWKIRIINPNAQRFPTNKTLQSEIGFLPSIRLVCPNLGLLFVKLTYEIIKIKDKINQYNSRQSNEALFINCRIISTLDRRMISIRFVGILNDFWRWTFKLTKFRKIGILGHNAKIMILSKFPNCTVIYFGEGVKLDMTWIWKNICKTIDQFSAKVLIE